ncbi:TonB-dependent receptor [Tardiphaga alba]|uniref:TonB-dependent receptor n=1 Tax=Tardiphaga alba TaxID=340268 RepID=A0ABX8A7V4_9BRAD|nr:TonB-dependent receptor [Tardiphaga alba]QUS39824.1 TonB-dependent receptor [Tardiphaga alba]
MALLTTASAHAVIVAMPTAAQAQVAVRQTQFNIPAGSMTTALAAFGRQSGLQVTYLPQIASGKQSSGVSGQISADAALAQLLQGSGLNYSFSNARTVAISVPGGASNAAMNTAGAITLDTIEVSGARVSAGDAPYRTPGSNAHVSREQIDRLPPTSPGDVFIGTPGVLNGGNRVGTSLNPNIRGLQGMGRVNTTVDGASNSSTSYRGYAGNRDETYVDPDLIGSIDISKGPSDSVGTGGIGGSINFRTLSAQDIVKPGDNWGVRVKTGIGGNTRSPFIPVIGNTAPPVMRDSNTPSFLNGDSWSGSAAAATMQENFEGIVAFSKRRQGNYYAGSSNVPDGFVFPQGAMGLNPGRNAIVRPGAEVYNTSEDTNSFLAKGKTKWGDGQSFELGYMLYDSKAGEEDEALLNNLSNFGQRQLSKTRLDTYTAKYRHRSDNPLLDLRANLWGTSLDHKRGNAFPAGIRDHSAVTFGGDVANTSRFDTAFGALSFDYGTEFRHEKAQAPELLDAAGQTSRGPNGLRTMTSAFGKSTYEPVKWLALSAGLRVDSYSAEGVGSASVFPDRSGSRVSPNFSVVTTPLEGLQLFAQYKEGYRPPSLRELYWELYTLQVNPNLRGEVSKNWEFGANLLRDDVLTQGDKLRFKAAYFRNRYDDYVIMQDVPDVPGQQHFANIDHANYHGFELSGSYDAGTVFVEGNYTRYVKAEYCTTKSDCSLPKLDSVLANVTPPTFVPPEWSGSVTGGVRFFDQALTIGGRAFFSSTRIGTNWPPENPAAIGLIGLNFTWPQFVVYDLFASYRFSEDTMMNLSIENITDQYYYGPLATTGMPSPGRTARLGLTHRFGGANLPVIPTLPPLGYASKGNPGDDWTGVYVGGHVAQLSSNVASAVTTAAGGPVALSEAVNFSDRGSTFGGQIGYNYQFDNRIVIGMEADFSMLDKRASSRTLTEETASLVGRGQLQSVTEIRLDWLATLRGRLGYSFGRLMVYGTGGAAFLQQSGSRSQYAAVQPTATPTNTDQFFTEADTSTNIGWTAGGGFEFTLHNNWSLKGEYTYAGFSDAGLAYEQAREGATQQYAGARVCVEYFRTICVRYATPIIPGSVDSVQGRDVSNNIGLHMAKVGLNYRF